MAESSKHNICNEQELISKPMKTKVSRRNQFLYKGKLNVEDDIEHLENIKFENKPIKPHTKDAESQTVEGKESKELDALRTKVKSLKSICKDRTIIEVKLKTEIQQLKEEIKKAKEKEKKISLVFEEFMDKASSRETQLGDKMKRNMRVQLCNVHSTVDVMYKERIHKSDEATGALSTLLSRFTPLERHNSSYNIILEMIGRWNKYKSEVDSLYRNYMLKLLEQCTEEQTSLEMVMLPSPNFPQEPSPSILTFFLHFDNISKVADTFPNNIARNPTIRLSSTSAEENCTARRLDHNDSLNALSPSSSGVSQDGACSLTTSQLIEKTYIDQIMKKLTKNFRSNPEIPLPAIIQKMENLTTKPDNKPNDQATWAGSNRNEKCVICHEYMTRGVMTLECKHIFHSQCIRKWLVTDSSCPICRACVQLNKISGLGSDQHGPEPF